MMKPKKKSRASKISSRSFNLLQAVVREIRKGKSFLVTTHYNPDGDALGSALALGTGLRKLGKKVKIYNRDKVPHFLQFLPQSHRVTQELFPKERFDAAFIVDCVDRERISEAFVNHQGIAKLIVLDHHKLSGRIGDINFIEVDAASSGMVVHKVLKKLGVPITKDIAIQIYCTLVTDTGSFSYSNTKAETFKLAYELVSAGANPWEVTKSLYENFPLARLRLLGKVMDTLELSPDQKIAWITVSQDMLKETHAAPENAEGFISLIRGIDSVEVALQFREEGDSCKVSFRSKDRVDVARLAGQFGGGGHARAAGCTLKGSLSESQAKILKVVAGAVNKNL